MTPQHEASIEDLLADILDDSKPIPAAPPPPAKRQPTPSQVALNVAKNTGNDKALTELAMDDPESFLDALMNEPKALEQAPTAPPLAAAGIPPLPVPVSVSQTPTVTETNVISDDDILQGILDGSVEPPVSEPETVTGDWQARNAELLAGTLAVAPPALAKQLMDAATGNIFTDSDDRTEPALKPVRMPSFTADDFAETMDIRSFATLVTLQTARWHAKVKDRKASNDAAAANDAKAEAFETRKHLLGGPNDALKKIHRAIDEARAAHYEMTLPWSTTSMSDTGRRVGGRLLPNTLFVEYTTVMAEKKKAMLAALNEFEPLYPQMVAEAEKKLGKRFDVREYPNVTSIRGHFDLSFDFQPIPKGDDFKGLAQAQLDALASKVNDNTRIMAENAMQDVWVRAYEAVGRMAERLSSPDKQFHGSLVQNVRDVARLMAHLNITQDAKVEKIRKLIEKHLCGHEMKEIKEKATLRTELAAHAVSILKEMDK